MLDWYEKHVFSRLIEGGLDRPGVAALRRQVLAPATGRILEIGPGTGLNLLALPAAVDHVTAIGPEPALHPLAAERARAAGVDLELVSGDAHRMPFAGASFDTAIVTFTLCSVADPARVTGEIARVLAPGGQLLFAEHIIARPGPGRWLQRLADPALRRINLGCSLLRDLAPVLSAALRIDRLTEDHMRAMPPLYRRVIHGRAARPAEPPASRS